MSVQKDSIQDQSNLLRIIVAMQLSSKLTISKFDHACLSFRLL